ncbi:MAG TPA: peptide ABC transporter [Chloroflexi bacterium]|nr:peptide ABC transporter [Chloroflexota bacterium]
MIRYAARRFLLLVPVLFGVTLLTFLLLHLTPGDPVATILGDEYENVELREQIRKEMGLDQPLPVQYMRWLSHTVRGDLGDSILTKEPVAELITARLPTTALLALMTMVISLAIAIPLGVISATHKDRVIDNIVRVTATGGVAVPVFWLGIMMILAFSLKLRWFPASGGISKHGLKALILPSTVLGVSYVALMTRLVRSEMAETLQQDFIRTAHAKGLRPLIVYYRHAFKNAMIPVVTIIGTQFGALLSGAVLTEYVFSLPGLGSFLIESIYRRDFPVIQGTVLVISLAFVLINLLVDLVYMVIDPRIRHAMSN